MRFCAVKVKTVIIILILVLMAFGGIVGMIIYHNHCEKIKKNSEKPKVIQEDNLKKEVKEQPKEKEDYIKWVEFNVTYKALSDACDMDIKTYGDENHLTTVEILSYLGAKYGGNFSNYKKQDIIDLLAKIDNSQTLADIVKDMKLYNYYSKAYSAAVGQLVGEYVLYKEENGKTVPVEKYGIKLFSPIAAGYSYSHFDDFGTSRSYGYKRRHQGHDMMGNIGTPIIAMEGGTIEAMGWNQYGGWRIGIRSFDKKRYYYYAHLRKNHPYVKSLKEGDKVKSGDVIGYMGMTGYSSKENVNNINVPHLHFGCELIFDESQKDASCQLWIDMYQMMKLLETHRSEVVMDKETNEMKRKNMFDDLTLSGGKSNVFYN